MSRRSTLSAAAVALLLLAAGAAFALFDPDARLAGWAKGEPFYRGRAATAWRRRPGPGGRNLAGRRPDRTRGRPGGGGPGLRLAAAALARGRRPHPRGRRPPPDGTGRGPAGPALIAALADPDAHVREVATRALGEIGPAEPNAVPALVARFPDVEAIRAVAKFKAAGGPAVPRLLELVNHPDEKVRWNVGRTLGRIGEPALPAVPALMEVMGAGPGALRPGARGRGDGRHRPEGRRRSPGAG